MVARDAISDLAAAGWTGPGLLAGLVIAGVALWLFGGVAMRIGYALLGAVVGGAAGVGAGAWLDTGVGTPTWILATVGAVVGLVIGITAFRFTVSLALGLALSALAPMAVMAGRQVAGHPFGATSAEPAGPLVGDDLLLDGVPVVDSFSDDVTREAARRVAKDTAAGFAHRAEGVAVELGLGEDSPAREAIDAHARRARAFAGELIGELRAEWERLPARERAILALSSLVGLALGFGVGMTVPKRAGAIVASGVGVAVWLPAALALVAALGAPMSWTPHDPLIWVGAWAGLTTMGVGVQWMGRRRPADKA